MQEQIQLLKDENKKLMEQIKRVEMICEYYENCTKEYINCTNNNMESKELKLELFQMHVNKLMQPNNMVDVLLRNFYFYLITHMEYENILNENKNLLNENKVIKKLLFEKK